MNPHVPSPRQIAQRAAVPLALLLLSQATATQQSSPTSKAELAAVTARGRILAAYDVATWHATDAVLARKPGKGLVARYIARKTDNGWIVDFGRLNESRDTFLVAYVATQGAKPDEFTVELLDPPHADSGFDLHAAVAIETCLRDSGSAKIPYNTAVLPADSDRLYVYLLPAQTKTHVYVYGGDVRYLVSPDGSAIIEKHPMHKSIFQTDNSKLPKGAQLAGATHSHILSDAPEDSDVFVVLTRKPPVPEFVGTKSHLYKIGLDGTISVMK